MNITEPQDEVLSRKLDSVAAGLFGPSPETLCAVALGGDVVFGTLPEGLQQELAKPVYAKRITFLRNSLQGNPDVVQVPFLTSRGRGAKAPQRGEIRTVDRVDINDPSSPRRYTSPVYVLLDHPVDPHPDAPEVPGLRVWQAWTVSPHVEYAAYWDVLLQGDAVPSDCGMVQVWNVVHVLEEHLGPMRFRLDDDQLTQVSAAWSEFVSGAGESEAIPTELSAGVRQSFEDFDVVTGSRLRGPDDPRFMFQRMYVHVRDAIDSACKQALQRSAKASTDVGAMLQALELIARASIRGLRDGRFGEGTPDRTPALANRDQSFSEGGNSSWVNANYAAAQRRLTLLLNLKALEQQFGIATTAGARYEFYVDIGDDGSDDNSEAGSLVLIQGTPVQRGERTVEGVFLLHSEHPGALHILSNSVNLTIALLAKADKTDLLVRVTIAPA